MSPQEGPKRKIKIVASGRFAQQFERDSGVKYSGPIDRSIDDRRPPFYTELTEGQKSRWEELVGKFPDRFDLTPSARLEGVAAIEMRLGEYGILLITPVVYGLSYIDAGSSKKRAKKNFGSRPFMGAERIEDGILLRFGLGVNEVRIATSGWGFAKIPNPRRK